MMRAVCNSQLMNETLNTAETGTAKDSRLKRRTKTWRIGEYCAGGVIRAKSCGEIVKLEIRDYYNDKILNHGAFGRIHERYILQYLEEFTSPYYADKVLQWIKVKVWGLS
jgi:predicted alpha/beta-fold hydrolase